MDLQLEHWRGIGGWGSEGGERECGRGGGKADVEGCGFLTGIAAQSDHDHREMRYVVVEYVKEVVGAQVSRRYALFRCLMSQLDVGRFPQAGRSM